ncbi:YVTN family beta-propeller repeat protein [Crocinitomix algicola]|uniref:YVTN family beta-propeller repeat protein n=1 Tax=Crocinitomix algicola TaxID=1740263 RepID=UPI00082C512D|nr:SPOR domain-containing protein [Crocinitomix algicola]
MRLNFSYQQYYKLIKLTFLIYLFSINLNSIAQVESHIRKKHEISGRISPKSIVTNGQGVFAAQNMMYRHTVVLYNQEGHEITTIDDGVNLSEFGYKNYKENYYRGAPVEGVFTEDGNYLWVSNYEMKGSEFNKPGCDQCVGSNYDPSFIYKINLKTHKIESVIKVGSVPKFIAMSTDQKTLIVSNWVSSDISIIDLVKEEEIKRVKVGLHPRGIAINKDGTKAYITVMGSTKIAVVDLMDYSVNYIKDIGKAPRSILLTNNDSTLLVSVNSSNKIVKVDLKTGKRQMCETGSGPRSMTLSPDEKWLYVVNYFDNSFSKINTSSMLTEATITTGEKPIGICGNWQQNDIWVACYSGKIEIFHDFKLPSFKEEDLTENLFSFLYTPQNSGQPTTPSLRVDKKKSKSNTEVDSNDTSMKSTIKDTLGNYHIIIGAFSIPENAEKRKNELLALNYRATVLKGKYNYVSIENYSSEIAAEEAKVHIQKQVEGCSSAWVLYWK